MKLAGKVAHLTHAPLGPLALQQLGRAWTGWLAAAVVLVAYVLLEWLSFIHEHKGLPITPWNPGLGLVFALMVLGGARYAVVLFAGAIVAEIAVLRSSLSWPVILGIAAIIACGYGAVAAMVRRRLRLDVGLNHLRDIFVLLLAGVFGALLVAVALSLLLLADEQLDLGDVLLASRPLLVGDVIGIAVVTPLALRLGLHRRVAAQEFSRLVPELILVAIVVVAALWAIVGAAGTDGFKLFYLLFLPVVVAAVRHGVDGACVALAITQLGLVGLLHRYGYDAAAFTEFQTLMLVLTVTGLTVGVVVTERQRAFETVREVERRLRIKEAEAAHAARFSLVSGTAAALAHEINQPMTAARALARSAQEILRRPQPDIARADTNLATVIAQIDHAGGVVKRMREFLRRGEPHWSTIDLRAMLDDALALARPEAAGKGVDLVLDAAADLPAFHGDRIQLQQVVLNLVRNAGEALASAAAADRRIRVTAQRRNGAVEIAVIDNGPGVAADIAARLFEPLATSKHDGLGLGLSISAAIVEAHGGRLWLHAGEPGATEFRFSLPIEAT